MNKFIEAICGWWQAQENRIHLEMNCKICTGARALRMPIATIHDCKEHQFN